MRDPGDRRWIVYNPRTATILKTFYLEEDARKAARRTNRVIRIDVRVEEWDGSLTLKEWVMWKSLQK